MAKPIRYNAQGIIVEEGESIGQEESLFEKVGVFVAYSVLSSLPYEEQQISRLVCSTWNDLLRSGCTKNKAKAINLCTYAAKYGYLEVLKYAHENGCPWSSDTCAQASADGQLECLRYMHENGCSWDKSTCAGAAGGGHLDCLIFAHENGCEWDSATCAQAAMSGHLECLAYAHENGCLWDSDTTFFAAKHGKIQCFTYAYENGCELVAHTCKLATEYAFVETTIDNGFVSLCTCNSTE